MRLCLTVIFLWAADAIADEEPLPWWQTAVFYQVYPRSFRDSNGDGIGDLRGITQNADYFTEIGVNAIWLSPFYKSPMKDFGYDISDFTAIEPTFGTMDDFDALMAKFKKIGVKVVIDFVPNHTSDQHAWFQSSLNKSDPLHPYYKDFYIWKDSLGNDTEGNPIPPNNWISVFEGPHGSMWEWREERQQFYFHQFASAQPDLNYRNPNVMSNMTAIMNFWLDKGIDGFRMDAVKFLYENASFPDEAAVPGTPGDTYETMEHNYDTDQPESFQVMSYWTDNVCARTAKDGVQRALFLEVYDPIDILMKYYGSENRSMQIPFNFNLLAADPQSRPKDLKQLIDVWMDNKPSYGINSWVVGNHDNIRVADRYGPEMVDAVNLLTGVLPGVKVVYYGEEIGMTNTFILWNQTVDPRGIILGPDHYTEMSRDPERTPLQWNDSPSAGFSSNKTTWLPVNPNYWWLNIEAQRNAPESHLKVFQAMAKAKTDPVLQRGNLQVVVPNEFTLVVIRSYNGTSYVLVINMASDVYTYTSSTLFNSLFLDTDMSVVTASINSGHTVGLNLRRGSLSVTLRPKAAILLKTTYYVGSSAPRVLSTSLLLFLSLIVTSVILRRYNYC